PMRETVITLLSSNAPARIAVPVDDFFGAAWTALDFDDGAWMQGINGVGYETDSQPPPPELVADSAAEFSATQGRNNWFYGYYNKTTDPGGRYQTNDFIPFPNDEGPHSPYNFWNGASWKWFDGNPPFDEIGERYMHPNGANHAQEHWTIRRWLCKASDTINIDWQLAKQSAGGTGVTARVFYNGTQKDIATIAGNSVAGVTRSLEITGVKPGDFIDFALAAAGTGTSTDDLGDGSLLSAKICALASLANQISTPIETAMRGLNASAYLRFPFVVTDSSAFEFLTLRMKYDAGFIAYLNGFEVARANAPDAPAWNSAATAGRLDSEASQFEDFNLSGFLSLLQVGTNVLAIHGVNESAADADFFIRAEMQAISQTADPSSLRYFSAPTPGRINGFGNTNLGPLILEAAHTPSVPMDNEDLSVTARVAPTFNAVSKVTLIYRVLYGVEASISMSDDGMHGDGAAGDGTYGGYIPAGASAPGQMVRYAITASDAKGNTSRWPLYPDPKNSPQYLGTIIANPAVTSALPVLHWFIQNPGAADNTSGTRCSVFYDGEFYDNILVYAHGQSSLSFPKKSYNFDLNSGYRLRYAPDQPRIHDFNLLTTYPDKAHLRNILSYETYRNAGSPYHFAFAVRVQRNGAFYSDAHFVENGDDVFLERLGLDPRGVLYKMFNTLNSATADVQKKTRKNENNSDLQALISGARLTGAARTRYLYDNVNIPEVINYLAAMIITGGIDCCHKNYYAYRDTEGTGEWQYLPWDVDLTFGRNWNSAQTYYDDVLHPDAPLYIGGNNALPAALFATPAIKQMYQRRVRTLMDQLLQPPGTAVEQLKFERRINELYTQIAPDAALDFAKWASWGQRQTLTQAVSLLRDQYLPARRTYLYNLAPPRGREVPAAQLANSFIKFGAIEYNPASGRQSQEYLQLFNTNAYAVDLSGWQLAGAVQLVFQAGVVIPTNSALYVSPDVVAFRARTNGPGGNQSLFVQGNYRGQLSARGETVHLLDDTGRLVNSITYPGNPSAAQLYLRVTEIMYHPAPPPAGSPFDQEDFEYLELKNIGPAALDLTGVHFAGGIDFDFTGSTVTRLEAGQSVLLVKNQAAFVSRYGGGFSIAGAFSGNLENNGENLRLEDALGEKVLEFDYNNSWDPVTDGQGFALVIVDELAPWNTWGDRASWRRSAKLGGSPGLTDPPPTPIPAILINEILTHTDPPLLDAIECFNPTPNEVNIGGWFLTDDRSVPKKFRIPPDTIIGDGGYLVFTEADFNPAPGVDPSFSLSSHGEEVFLFSADSAGNLTGYSDGFPFDAGANGVSFGRYTNSAGEVLYPLQATNTFGSTNAGPRVGPVVISEIQYLPPPGGDEFIELKNTSNDAIKLYDPAHPTNTWKLNGAAFSFPTNTQIPAHGLLLVAGTDPATFR
ncbi:MAG: lamin tail domain-containing protein, partial [Chloroflexi bacterium]|nr:lamin tail domain-containing protein [Chloroflexota bacterium]